MAMLNNQRVTKIIDWNCQSYVCFFLGGWPQAHQTIFDLGSLSQMGTECQSPWWLGAIDGWDDAVFSWADVQSRCHQTRLVAKSTSEFNDFPGNLHLVRGFSKYVWWHQTLFRFGSYVLQVWLFVLYPNLGTKRSVQIFRVVWVKI